MKSLQRNGRFMKAVLLSLVCILTITACSSGGGSGGSDDTVDPQSESEGTPSSSENIGPMTKYDPPIEVSMVRNLSDVVENNVLTVLEDETFEDNRWSRVYEEEQGIHIVYDWIVKGSPDSDQYTQKLNVTLASGDLPDVIPVNAVQLKQLVESDMVQDMTAVYEEFATPLLKDIMSREGTPPFDAATIDGKLMAVPLVDSSMESAMFVWIRTDWMDNLGLEPPRTMSDLREISRAFTEDDPDQNGVDDTYGLALTKDLWGGSAGLEGFMAGFNAYPNIWLEDDEGSLTYGSIQPEVRDALLALQEMAANGEIDQEFGIKDGNKVAEDLAAGKIGIEFGEQWNSIWPLQMNVDNDPDAQWQAFPIVSDLTDTPTVPLKFRTSQFFAVRKDFEHPEAVVKMFNTFVEKNWGETAEFDYYYAPPNAESVWQLSPVTPSPATKNLDAFRDIEAARQANDFSTLEGEPKTIQEKLDMYYSGSEEGFALWGWERIYGPDGSMGITGQYEENGQLMIDKFVGAPTPTMVERQATLEKMQDEVFVKIILGDPIENFDQFVADWHQLGGEQIIAEVNEWYANSQ